MADFPSLGHVAVTVTDIDRGRDGMRETLRYENLKKPMEAVRAVVTGR